MKRRRLAFTLTELLTVIFIIGLLAAILLPVFMQARAKAHQSACASNMRQLGAALVMYCGDYDEEAPSQSAPRTLFASAPPVNIGWAGKIYSYVKNADVFHCPGDPTGSDGKARPVSYAINLNMAFPSHLAALTAPSHSVMLFEVVKSATPFSEADEGASQSPAPPQFSAAANGAALLGWPTWDWTHDKRKDYPFVLYATGCLNNVSCDGHDDWYDTTEGRHHGGANFLAADGHVKWLKASQVSAGANAALSSNGQTSAGCQWMNDSRTLYPCAEGTLAGKHPLTFSVQ